MHIFSSKADQTLYNDIHTRAKEHYLCGIDLLAGTLTYYYVTLITLH